MNRIAPREARHGKPRRRRQRRVPAVPDAARHAARRRPRRGDALARVPRAHRALHAEGGARGEGAHELDQPATRRTRAALLRLRARAARHAAAEPVSRGPDACRRRRLAWFGALNSLTMALLKFTSPGVPDLYQGNELIDFSLVDPDNRRPVDYELRERALAELAAIAAGPDPRTAARALAEQPHDGRAKLFVTWRLLEARRRMPELFRDGELPRAACRRRAQRACARLRTASRSRHARRDRGPAVRQLGGAPGQLPLGEAVWGDTEVEMRPAQRGQAADERADGETNRGRRAVACRSRARSRAFRPRRCSLAPP